MFLQKFDFISNLLFFFLLTELEPALEKNKRMRFNLFMDLYTTESNYVGILKTIVTVSRLQQQQRSVIENLRSNLQNI